MLRTLPRLLPLLLGLLAGSAAAQAKAGAAAEPLRARLVCEGRALVAGSTASLGVVLELAAGWHTYAPFLNDSGVPLTLQPTLPEGFAVRAAEWPAPQRLVSPGEMLDHVYEGRVLLPLPVEVPASAAGSRVTLTVHVGWMVCRSVCQLGEADLTLELPVVPASARVEAGPDAPLFAEARARTPRPAAADSSLTAAWDGNALSLRAPGAAALAFYPDADAPPFENLLRDGEREGETLSLPLRDAAPAAPARGVVELRWPGGRPPTLLRIEVPAPSNPGPAPRAPQPEESHDVR